MLRPRFLIGGVENHIQILARELIRRGHEVGLVTSRHSSTDVLRTSAISVSFAPLYPSTPLHTARSVAYLVEYIRREKIDVLHSHHRFTTVVGRIVSRLTGIPLVVSVHEFKHNRRWLASLWTGSITVAPSQALAAHLRTFYGVPEEKIRVIPNAVDLDPGIDLERAAVLRQRLNYRADQPWVGFVGRLSPEKGCHVFVSSIPHILKQVPDARCIIAGSGPDQAALRQQAQALGIDPDSIFVGERTEIPELMSLLDIVVIPSISENFPLVALEAMRAARPVVASAVGGIPEVVRDGETGLLVQPQAPDELAAMLCRLLARPDERHVLGMNGQRIVNQHFSPAVMAERMLRAYQDALTSST